MALSIRRSTIVSVEGLGDRIRKAREASGKTPEELAAKASISKSYWYDLENERIRVTVPEETFRRVEAALGVDLGVTL